MTHIITSLCVNYGECLVVCPVENCIIPGPVNDEWPQYYINPETCIDCGACLSVCPFAAIFEEEEVPTDYLAMGGEYLNLPASVLPDGEVYETEDINGKPIRLMHTRRLEAGEEIDFSVDIERNRQFFESGPDQMNDEGR